MALTVTNQSVAPVNLGAFGGYLIHDDVTEYASGGWAPKPAVAGAIDGILVVWQENADYNFRWDATNKKVLAYVMSTGAEAAAVDVGELKYLMLTRAGA